MNISTAASSIARTKAPIRTGRTMSHRNSTEGPASEVTVTASLRMAIRHLQQSLDGHLERLSLAITPDTVRSTRTAARRLRAVLRAFKRNMKPAALRRYARTLRELAHALDSVREADVAQHTISTLLAGKATAAGEGWDGLKSLVARNRAEAARDLESAMRSDPWAARLVELRRAASDSGLVVESREPMAAVILRVLQQRRRRLRAALRYHGQAARKLHRIRLRIKMLRYLLEQCVSTHARWARAEIKQLRELQDCLGDFHDVWCLKQAVKHQELCRRPAAELAAGIKTRQRDLVHRFRYHRRRLRRIWRAGTTVASIEAPPPAA